MLSQTNVENRAQRESLRSDRKTASRYWHLKVETNAMNKAGIKQDDIILIDRQRFPTNDSIIVARLDGLMLIRRYHNVQNHIRLIADSEELSAIEVDTRNCQFEILGTVIGFYSWNVL